MEWKQKAHDGGVTNLKVSCSSCRLAVQLQWNSETPFEKLDAAAPIRIDVYDDSNRQPFVTTVCAPVCTVLWVWCAATTSSGLHLLQLESSLWESGLFYTPADMRFVLNAADAEVQIQETFSSEALANTSDTAASLSQLSIGDSQVRARSSKRRKTQEKAQDKGKELCAPTESYSGKVVESEPKPDLSRCDCGKVTENVRRTPELDYTRQSFRCWTGVLVIVFCALLFFGRDFAMLEFVRVSKCSDWLAKANLSGLEAELKSSLFGQHIATSVIVSQLKRHLENAHGRKKPLTLLLYGSAGTGKTFTSHIVGRHLFSEGGKSKFWERVFVPDFLTKYERTEVGNQLKLLFTQKFMQCSRKLFFVVEEAEKGLDSALHSKLIPILNGTVSLKNGKDTSNTAVVFLLINFGASALQRHTAKFLQRSGNRSRLSFSDVSGVLAASLDREKERHQPGDVPGAWKQVSDLLDSGAVDLAVPFLPLEADQVRHCVAANMRQKNISVTEGRVNQVLEDITFIPADKPLFSSSGCKRLDRLVDYHFGWLSGLVNIVDYFVCFRSQCLPPIEPKVTGKCRKLWHWSSTLVELWWVSVWLSWPTNFVICQLQVRRVTLEDTKESIYQYSKHKEGTTDGDIMSAICTHQLFWKTLNSCTKRIVQWRCKLVTSILANLVHIIESPCVWNYAESLGQCWDEFGQYNAHV